MTNGKRLSYRKLWVIGREKARRNEHIIVYKLHVGQWDVGVLLYDSTVYMHIYITVKTLVLL